MARHEMKGARRAPKLLCLGATLGAALSAGAVLGGCDVTNKEDVELDVRLYTPFGQESLLDAASSRVTEIEVVAVQAGAPTQRIGVFDLASGAGALSRLPIGDAYQLFFRGFSDDDSLLFFGASRPFDVVSGEAPKAAVIVGPTSCVVENTGAPEGYADPNGTQDMGPVRVGHTATALPDGRVLIIGGARMEAGLITEIYSSMEIYDPNEGVFQALSAPFALQSPRAWHSATLLEDGRVLVVGGLSTIDGRQTPARTLALVDVNNPDEPVRLVEGLFPEGQQRYRHTATRLDDGSGSVLIAGGYGADRVPLRSAWRYFPSETADPTEGAFRRQGDMCQARVEHSTTTLFFQGGRAQAVAAGGLIPDGANAPVPTDSIELFTSNPNQLTGCCGGDGLVPSEAVGCWVSPAGIKLDGPRYAHTALNVDDDRQVLFVGGHRSADRSDGLADLEMMDSTLTLWQPNTVGRLGEASVGVGDAAVALLPDETVLVVGGRAGDTVTNRAYQLVPFRDNDGSVRQGADPNDPPIARYGSAPLGDACLGEPRYEHEAVTMATGTVLLLGGITQGAGGQVTTRRAELFFPLVSDLPTYYP